MSEEEEPQWESTEFCSMQVMVTLRRTASSQGWLHNLQGSTQNEYAGRPGSGKSIFPFHGSAYSGPANPKELQSPCIRYLDGVRKRPMSVTPNHHHNTSVVLSVGALGMGGNSCCFISPSQPPSRVYTLPTLVPRWPLGAEGGSKCSLSLLPPIQVIWWPAEAESDSGRWTGMGSQLSREAGQMWEVTTYKSQAPNPQSIIHCPKHDPLSH